MFKRHQDFNAKYKIKDFHFFKDESHKYFIIRYKMKNYLSTNVYTNNFIEMKKQK